MPLPDDVLAAIKVHAGSDAFVYHAALPTESQLDLEAAYTVFADARLVAAGLLDMASTAAGELGFGDGIKKFKQDGDIEVEFFAGTSASVKAAAWADRAARLRSEVLRISGRFGPPLAGIAVGRGAAPQAFVLGSELLPPDRQRLGGVPPILDREGP